MSKIKHLPEILIGGGALLSLLFWSTTPVVVGVLTWATYQFFDYLFTHDPGRKDDDYPSEERTS